LYGQTENTSRNGCSRDRAGCIDLRIPFVFITLFWIPMALWLVIAFVSYIIGLGLFVLNTKRKSSLLVFIAAELLMCISPVIAILYFCFSEYCGP
jgi:hypothetical protein